MAAAEVIISGMTLRDIARIIEIEKLSFTHRWSLNDFTTEVLHPHSICRTALIDGIIVGYICVRIMVDEAHVLKLAVHPEFRQRHIGTALVSYITEQALTDFKGKAILEVRESNIAALKVYSSIGFKNLYVRRGYYAYPAEDAVVMALDLSNSSNGAI
ncbi:MAG: ribosomal protein S18-alanine N-acetyltransferase [Candidatus Magnetominusculus sp. LBB02]|nr:ribosomal protein S18-alanine N-acetyltransferase [Candidatus Magnetominusculus sp. LBB02]